MHRLVRIGLLILIALGIVFFSLCMWGISLVTRSLPETTGILVLPDLHADVRIYRDGYSIPHIFSQNTHDLFYAQGFVTAQDRLWQMDLWRRVSQGRLSEIFGRRTLRMDSLMITIGIHRTAQKASANLSSETRDAFQAYSDGINAYIKKYYKSLPIEFIMLNYKPAPWKIEDCISIIRWLDWNMNVGWDEDILLGTLVDQFGWDEAKILLPTAEHTKPEMAQGKSYSMLPLVQSLQKIRDNIGQPTMASGSNGWVVSGDRSVTGRPMLANDPHLSLDCPSIFYENHLIGGGFNVSGSSIPGLPGVIYGHNEHIAWGLASLMADNLDFHIVTLNPSNSTKYRYNGTFRDLEIIEEVIPVRMDSSVHMIIYKTHYGPIVSDVLSNPRIDNRVLAIHWTGHEIKDPGLAFYRINLASDWESFRSALRLYENAPQNFIYADRHGDIGLQAAGKIPLRNGDTHFLPRSLTNTDSGWNGYIPFDALPTEKNPSSGFLATANNALVYNSSSTLIRQLPALPSRFERIQNLLSEKDVYSVQDFKRIQCDLTSLYNRNLIAAVIPYIKQETFQDSSYSEMLTELEQWDGQMKPGSFSAALSQVFIEKCLRNLFWDEMGDTLFNHFTDLQSISLSALQRVLRQDYVSWFDDVKTNDLIETKSDIILSSFNETNIDLENDMGKQWRTWSWGKIHTVTFHHPMGWNALLVNALSLGPFHVGGSGTSINCFGHSLRSPYDVQWGPAARSIYDLNNWDNSVSVTSTGQSGQPLDSHYRDQVQLYIGNLYHPNLADTAKILRSGWDQLILHSGGT